MKYVNLWTFVLLLAACANPFPPNNRVGDLRILAIRADHPSMQDGVTATVDALIYSPRNNTLRYQWSWCPSRGGADAKYECALSEEEFQAKITTAGDFDTKIHYSLGTTSVAQFPYLSTSAVLASVCAAMNATDTTSKASADSTAQTTPSQCRNGFAVSIRLTVSDGRQTARAYKEIRLLLDTKQTANQNPVITDLRYEVGGEFLALGTATAPTTVGHGSLVVSAQIPEESAEWTTSATAQPAASGGTTGATHPSPLADWFSAAVEATATTDSTAEDSPNNRETLRANWYITAGSTAHETTTASDESEWEQLAANRWNLDAADTGLQEILLVLRDNRGGVAWVRKTVRVKKE